MNIHGVRLVIYQRMNLRGTFLFFDVMSHMSWNFPYAFDISKELLLTRPYVCFRPLDHSDEKIKILLEFLKDMDSNTLTERHKLLRDMVHA